MCGIIYYLLTVYHSPYCNTHLFVQRPVPLSLFYLRVAEGSLSRFLQVMRRD